MNDAPRRRQDSPSTPISVATAPSLVRTGSNGAAPPNVAAKVKSAPATPTLCSVRSAPVPTVNCHLVRSCNRKCGFCFATFADVKRETGVKPLGLPGADARAVIDELAEFGFTKINFAGGEPMLRADLPDLIAHAKRAGLITSVVTNASKLDARWIEAVAGRLDQLAFSLDSANPATRVAMGRAVQGGKPLSNEWYLRHAKALRAAGVMLKLNSVITSHNAHEDLSAFVRELAPARWKIFQALRVAGQNDHTFAALACPDEAFHSFVSRHRRGLEDTQVAFVPETNDAMTASYAMVDPFGRFFDNHAGRHSYSPPILTAGARAAFGSVSISADKFAARGGHAGVFSTGLIVA